MILKTLGDYNLLKKIGQGSFGEVYLAEHKFIKKNCVIKILSEELSSDSEFIERFEKDVEVLTSFDHPSIVKIHNISYADGRYFLVMNAVVDSSLEPLNLIRYLEMKKLLREDELESLLKQIALALDYAHQKKFGEEPVLHRGLKPTNVFVEENERGLKVYLSDFGLSHLIGEGKILLKNFELGARELAFGQQDHRQYLTFLENFAFLAPEQKMQKAPLTPAVDSFAFGALAYYVIVRKLPEGCFEIPSKIIPEYKNNWDLLICKCLQRDPQKRPENLIDAMNSMLSTPGSISSLEVLSWEEVERKVENAMQMSFEFLTTEVEKSKNKAFEEKSEKPERPEAFERPEKIEKSQEFLKPFPKETVSKYDATMSVQQAATSASFRDVNQSAFRSPLHEPSIQTKDQTKETKMALEKEVQQEISQNPLNAPKPFLNPPIIARPQYDPDPSLIFQKELNVSHYQPEKVEIKEVEPLLTEMVIIPSGHYLRGSNEGVRDEAPSHNVLLSNFALDIHPVTNEQFVRFLESMGGEKDANNNDVIRLRDSRVKKSSGHYIIESGYAKHPVVGVTWYGAEAYAKWVGKRLPTEAEWEIAARGNLETSLYPTGVNIDHTQANYFNTDTTTVMSYPPNGFGLYDMCGNVYEWCQDWYAYNYYETSIQEPENPKGPHQGVYRVLRGGCWKSLKEDLRCSHRHRNNPGTVNSTYGFRCATDVL